MISGTGGVRPIPLAGPSARSPFVFIDRDCKGGDQWGVTDALIPYFGIMGGFKQCGGIRLTVILWRQRGCIIGVSVKGGEDDLLACSRPLLIIFPRRQPLRGNARRVTRGEANFCRHHSGVPNLRAGVKGGRVFVGFR